jgi:tripartite-type tricarboxylate transporter receptor subunit TctC
MHDFFFSRRHFLRHCSAVASGGLAALNPNSAVAAAFPERPIRLVIPSAAGGAPDILCRILTAEITRQRGWTFVIDNRPGGGGNLGVRELLASPADGYTLGYGNVVTLAINRSLFAKPAYDVERDLAPVAMMGSVSNLLLVRKDLPVNSVRELVALARSKPGQLTLGSPGVGTTGHLGGELFKSMTQTFIVHVPYRGSPAALQDMMGGRVDLMFDNISSAAPHVREGRVRALAVSGARRSALFPDLPTVAQAGIPGYETEAWGGIVAPARTPKDTVALFNAEINRILSQPAVRERFNALAFDLDTGPPEKLFDRARKEWPMWAAVIKRSGASTE